MPPCPLVGEKIPHGNVSTGRDDTFYDSIYHSFILNTMALTTKEMNKKFSGLNKFLKNNPALDWQRLNLLASAQVDALSWKGIGEQREQVFKQVKGYQRLVRLLGEDDPDTIKALLALNIHSVIQIAAMSNKIFKQTCGAVFNDNDVQLEAIYKKATAIRGQLLLSYMNYRQQAEPHISQVKTLSSTVAQS